MRSISGTADLAPVASALVEVRGSFRIADLRVDTEGARYISGGSYDFPSPCPDRAWGMFLAKYTADGSLAWANRACGGGPENGAGALDLVVDDRGESHQLVMSSNGLTFTEAGSPAFHGVGQLVVERNREGHLKGVYRAAFSHDPTGNAVAAVIGSDGRLVFGGAFHPVPGNTRFSFLRKLRTETALGWDASADWLTTSSFRVHALAATRFGHVWVAANFGGRLRLEDGLMLTNRVGDLSQDAFLARYSIDGRRERSMVFPVPFSFGPGELELVTRSDEGLYVSDRLAAGVTREVFGSLTLTNATESARVLASFGSAGDLRWARTFPALRVADDPAPLWLAAEDDDGVLAAGFFDPERTADDALGPHEQTRFTIAKFDARGTLVWRRDLGLGLGSGGRPVSSPHGLVRNPLGPVEVVGVSLGRDRFGDFALSEPVGSRAFLLSLWDGPAPALGITRRGADLVMSWPVRAEGFSLESRRAFGNAPKWESVLGASKESAGDLVSYVVPSTDGARWYRLRRTKP